jgi:hypothetical protein
MNVEVLCCEDYSSGCTGGRGAVAVDAPILDGGTDIDSSRLQYSVNVSVASTSSLMMAASHSKLDYA